MGRSGKGAEAVPVDGAKAGPGSVAIMFNAFFGFGFDFAVCCDSGFPCASGFDGAGNTRLQGVGFQVVLGEGAILILHPVHVPTV